MKIIVGDEFGLIKCVDANKKLISSKHGEMKKQNGVIGINNLFDNTNNTLAITHEQNFYVLDWTTKNVKSEPHQTLNEKLFYTSQIVKRTVDFSSVILSKSNNFVNLIQYDDDLNVKSNSDFEIKTKKLHTIKDSHITQEFFCLFKDSPVSIYNLDRNEITWKAKNLPNDELDLQIPIFDVDLANSRSNPNHFYTATAYGDIRFYDKKIKPRPVSDKKVFDRKINRMVISNCDNYLTIGDTLGNIFMLDKRKNFAVAKSLKGSTGAIKDILHVKGSNLTFSCGYDRFLRVFDFKTNEDLPQIYLKNKLNVIFPYDVKVENESDDEEKSGNSKDDYDDEDLFEEGEDDEEQDNEDEVEEFDEDNEDNEDDEDEEDNEDDNLEDEEEDDSDSYESESEEKDKKKITRQKFNTKTNKK